MKQILILFGIIGCLILSVYGYFSDISFLFTGASTFCACLIGVLMGDKIRQRKDSNQSTIKTSRPILYITIIYGFTVVLTIALNNSVDWLNFPPYVMKVIIISSTLGVVGLALIQYLIYYRQK